MKNNLVKVGIAIMVIAAISAVFALYHALDNKCTNAKGVGMNNIVDFGAVGDGVTDDSAAIRAAHAEANEKGLAVLGNPDATYYIGAIDLKEAIEVAK